MLDHVRQTVGSPSALPPTNGIHLHRLNAFAHWKSSPMLFEMRRAGVTAARAG
jgi:hypothetical protein